MSCFLTSRFSKPNLVRRVSLEPIKVKESEDCKVTVPYTVDACTFKPSVGTAVGKVVPVETMMLVTSELAVVLVAVTLAPVAEPEMAPVVNPVVKVPL